MKPVHIMRSNTSEDVDVRASALRQGVVPGPRGELPIRISCSYIYVPRLV